MQTRQFGDGTPEVVVVGGIHGDEPCGPAAIRRVIEAHPDVNRPVEFIVANDRAIDADERYLEADLNRSFPGNPDGVHEERLAARLWERVSDCVALSLHSTRSTARPFAITGEIRDAHRPIYRGLPLDTLVVSGDCPEGALSDHPNVIDVECGLQGAPETVETAVEVVWAFLSATGVVDASTTPTPVEIYRIFGEEPKHGEAEVFADNFEPVNRGEVYATDAAGDRVATEKFWPVLMSADGYRDRLGYRGKYEGRLAPLPER